MYRLLVEKESHDKPGILQNGRSRWSKALQGVVGEDRPILDVKTLKSVKNIGPKLSKVHSFLLLFLPLAGDC